MGRGAEAPAFIREENKPCCAGKKSQHSTVNISNTTTQPPLAKTMSNKGIMKEWYGNFRCVGASYTLAGFRIISFSSLTFYTTI